MSFMHSNINRSIALSGRERCLGCGASNVAVWAKQTKAIAYTGNLQRVAFDGERFIVSACLPLDNIQYILSNALYGSRVRLHGFVLKELGHSVQGLRLGEQPGQ